MLRYTRESLVLVLIFLLPLHALLVTVGTRLVVGVGQAPLPVLATWKEFLLILVLFISLYEFIFGRNPKLQIDILDLLVVGLIVLGIIIPSSNFIYGFKYTLFPLCLFVILRRVTWSEEFAQRAKKLILVASGVVAGYGILTVFLPQEFFTWIGYSDLHSLYIPDGPLAAFQQIGGTGIRRMQSTMSGPNQLGMWLLIPLSVLICSWMQKIPSPGGGGLGRGDKSMSKFHLYSDPLPLIPSRREGWYFALLVILGIALFLTFSRSAWVAAVTIVIISFYYNRKCRPSTTLRVTLAVVICVFIAFFIFPDILLRTTSTRGHFKKPLQAIQTIIAHPFGLGLGSAGPAGNRVSDPCVYLEPGADTAWAKDRQDLCVFVGDTQVQPLNRTCRCPLLPESWYLQIGVELGVLGLAFFVLLVVLILKKLLTTHYSLLTGPISLSFLGVSISALFLHSWEDAAVAYTMWLLVSSALPFSSSTIRGVWGGEKSE